MRDEAVLKQIFSNFISSKESYCLSCSANMFAPSFNIVIDVMLIVLRGIVVREFYRQKRKLILSEI
jgi:hypothetical protein